MILTCPECSTKFRLDDNRVPSAGAKVRCSRCQYIFQVERPKSELPAPAPPPLREPALDYTPEWAAIRKRSSRKASFLALALIFLLAAGAFIFYEKSEDVAKAWDYVTALRQYLAIWEEKEGKIALEKLRGFYVDNQLIGRIFVIEGQAVNQWNESRSFIRVKGTLLNPQGQKVLESRAFCGNILSEKDLKEMTKEAMQKSLSSQFGISFSNMNVPPGKAVPFMIVFTDFPAEGAAARPSEKAGEAPPDLSDFTVEVIGSQKGSK